jgi:acyl-CoA dehydrogenase
VENIYGHNLWLDDPNLQFLVRRYTGRDLTPAESAMLVEAGRVIGGPVARNAETIDKNPPELVAFSRAGVPLNKVVHCPAGLESRRLLWALAPGAFNGRLPGDTHPIGLMAMRLMLGSVDSGLSCAMGVTGPMTYLVHKHMHGDLKALLVQGVEDPNYDTALFSTIWLTEQSGGSDLGALETTARLDSNGVWRLRGLKWFCSITDARLIMTLARPEGLDTGINNLALFIIPREGFPGSPQLPNAVHIRRLKSKLGLRSVPSGEVELRDAIAWPCGDPMDGKGINRIMEVVSPAQRNGVAAMGAGITRRSFIYAREYGMHRISWGKPLTEHGSFRVHLLDMMAVSEACATLVLRVQMETDAFGQPSLGPLVRVLAPLSKLRCCRSGVTSASKALETFGGNGYIADWPLERLYRDAQNHPIWEGTEQVMGVDVLRALSRLEVASALLAFFDSSVHNAQRHPVLAPLSRVLHNALSPIRLHIASIIAERPKSRDDSLVFANALADVVQLTLLMDDALFELQHSHSARKAIVAAWFSLSLQVVF